MPSALVQQTKSNSNSHLYLLPREFITLIDQTVFTQAILSSVLACSIVKEFIIPIITNNTDMIDNNNNRSFVSHTSIAWRLHDSVKWDNNCDCYKMVKHISNMPAGCVKDDCEFISSLCIFNYIQCYNRMIIHIN